MKQLQLIAKPYKSLNARGIREYIYEIWEHGWRIAAWHEDRQRDYTGAIVRQFTSGNHTGYTCSPFKNEPTLHDDNIYGVAYANGTKWTDGTAVIVDRRGIISLPNHIATCLLFVMCGVMLACAVIFTPDALMANVVTMIGGGR